MEFRYYYLYFLNENQFILFFSGSIERELVNYFLLEVVLFRVLMGYLFCYLDILKFMFYFNILEQMVFLVGFIKFDINLNVYGKRDYLIKKMFL